MEINVLFWDTWLWLCFAVTGIVLVILELLAGVDTGYDMLFIGSAFIFGGLVTWPFTSWMATIVVTSIVCLAYLFLGRKYVHRLKLSRTEKTNIDRLINLEGTVLQNISRNSIGLVRVGYEEWRATAEEDIGQGEKVTVIGIRGVTLIVKRANNSRV